MSSDHWLTASNRTSRVTPAVPHTASTSGYANVPRFTPTHDPARSAVSFGSRPVPLNARCATNSTAACAIAHKDTATDVASNVKDANVIRSIAGSVALKSTFNIALPTSTSTSPTRFRK